MKYLMKKKEEIEQSDLVFDYVLTQIEMLTLNTMTCRTHEHESTNGRSTKAREQNRLKHTDDRRQEK